MKARVLFAVLISLATSGGLALAQNLNGSAGQMPAYYCGLLFTINFKEQPTNAEKALLAHNGSINLIYQSDQAVAEGFDFVNVINALQGDGFNPLWQEVQIIFADGVEPIQFTQESDILMAYGLGLIDLVPTNQVYRCSVVGSKK